MTAIALATSILCMAPSAPAQSPAVPNADLATVRLVDTGNLTDTDRVAVLGLEGLWASGPFKVQGEYYRMDADRYRAGNSDFSGSGWYVSGLWNITGEKFGYKARVLKAGEKVEKNTEEKCDLM